MVIRDPGNDETRLVAAARKGNRVATEVLIQRSEPVVARTVIGMLGPGPDAEDTGQEAMVRFLRSLDRFEGSAGLKTYVTRIAMNASLDALRRRKTFLRRFAQSASATGDAVALEDLPDKTDQAADLESRQLLLTALGKLKPDFRSVLVLRELHGYTTEEVAEIMNIAQGTVLSRLARGKAQLATLLKGYIGND